MGSLAKHNLKQIRSQFDCKFLVETGTGMGISAAIASETFEKVFTIEMHPECYKMASGFLKRFQNVKIYNLTSVLGLATIFSDEQPEGYCLFWLDAHFPGADYGFAGYGDIKEDEIRLPLKSELKILLQYRNYSNDVFIIDDLRLYEKADYQNGNCVNGDGSEFQYEGISFIEDLFKETHNINRDLRDEGYIVITPKIKNA